MSQESIKCPKCNTQIPLSEALSHDIEERARLQYQSELDKNKKAFESQLIQKDQELQEKIKNEQKILSSKVEELQEKYKHEARELEKKLKVSATEEIGVELADLKAQVDSSKKKLKEAQEHELVLRKKQRDLEEKEKSLEIEMARKMDEEREKIEDTVASRFEEQHKLKNAEKDKRLSDALRQVDDLKRKMEQGSQQSQGEILEVELEELLKREFPFDSIEPVSKGVKGADILHAVKTQSGRSCGKILWETKRTKNWSDSWLQKLKDDQGESKADIAVLVSESLPSGFHHFRQMNGVWVTDIPSVFSLALALRMVLIQVATAKEIESSKDDKKDLIYRYVTGPEFKNRVTAIIEGFRTMKDDLEAEKRAMTRIWDKRNKQIERIISNTAGMYGDLEGLAGSALSHMKILELPTCEDEQEESEDGE